ncbi:MAG TPA: hypothetical protein VGP55_09015 [Chitinophagaceae bacterium]|nr:hypothetical protein [Chitinophagaceae bacterium]
MKKSYLIISAIVVVIIVGYLYLRFSVLKNRDFKPDHSKAKSIIDLRPALIAKLKQVVRDASAGLYKLDVDNINVALSNTRITLTHVSLLPDSNVITTLEKQG